MATIGPACSTCRRACRRCDRAKPACDRCVSKGVKCGGYPEKYKFCGLASRGKWRDAQLPVAKKPTRSTGRATRRPQRLSVQCTRATPSPAFNGQPEPRSRPLDALDLTALPNINAVLEISATEGIDVSVLDEPDESLDALLVQDRTEVLLAYYDEVICPHQIAMVTNNIENPYRKYILPLAYEHVAPLCAILGLSACHQGIQQGDREMLDSEAVQYRLQAIRSLASLLAKDRRSTLSEVEQAALLATIQLLILHDICETGISSHGAHVTGSSVIGERWMEEGMTTSGRGRTVFFLANLAWLDVTRSFAGPERLCFSWTLMQAIIAAADRHFEMVNGCPRDIFLIVGYVLWSSKQCSLGILSLGALQDVIRAGIVKLQQWNSTSYEYPTTDPLWFNVAEAFRAACMLWMMRLLEPSRPAKDAKIESLVTQVLDNIAEVPVSSPLLELLVLPLFIAGADAMTKHSRYYVIFRLDEIKGRSGFANPAPKDLLRQVWQTRDSPSTEDELNVPWMRFTFSTDLERQNDYIII
ncbi:C6 zinc finger domain protein [Exophiala viscosa]|uniref:C6 zinc finger domain protein n=1 Tax=Exophiala viscosa TaxID=2486360 RepID=UPI00219A2C52|nr:C6 zinc finger domain protein [Exophiala viscosa]